MARLNMGDERTVSVLFLSACDAVAAFYRFLPEPADVEALNQRLESQPPTA
ncbi:hypothetical protein [Methylobacterium nodulans]|uniref:Uncharacterized protein n=1 Tax=Methylobacterium nodulans (strain LMG 21967 / CNCM I-2342 / ORS 2060) TaxID=460265 RepID=B8IKW3_METNO|nr:hypothetical protein [Methylobacterium nodulans]ACL58151.1 hypothetical protein Mnod_3226 [Methylobacterium nodulans ORS 2060]